MTVHGGNVNRVAAHYGIPVESILDFSANINPRGLPPLALARLARDARDGRVLALYPDPDASELRCLLSQRLEVPQESILIGAGADSLIHAAVRALSPKRCIIPIPAFAEYQRACRAFGCAVHVIPLAPAARFALDTDTLQVAQPGDLIILNNPHNPTGAHTGPDEMLDRIRTIRSRGASVLVDEAFVDYAPGIAVTSEAVSETGVIAVRSLTKFFGCAGLRVGYAVAAPETARRLAIQLPAWPVTTLALNALVEALRDDEYIDATIKSNERNKASLPEALGRLGCRVFPPAANFVFFEVPNAIRASEVRERLIREHAILVRDCDSFDGLEAGRYLRIAVRLESENSRLIEGLATVLGGSKCRKDS